ncbi:MAG TPA: DNA replication and repair protein RecF [Acidimicrobiales bacterium]|nr:DNA replication and repair protein RecF [Acidimicrobiales bacterium]
MGLHELNLRNFRLFREISFQPDRDAVTVLLSANGTGKTSILEAVHALATANSFRTTSAADMIRAGEGLAEVHGVMFQRQRRVQVDLTLTRGVRNTTKRMLVNGQRPRSRADLSEVLPLTVFTPEGVDIVRQGPEGRRSFLTNLLTDVDLSTGEVIERFNRVLSQRNALLRSLQSAAPTAIQRDEIDVWTQDFGVISELVVDARERTVADLTPLVSHFYGELSGSDDVVVVRYERSWEGHLIAALQAAFDDDRFRGHTTVGPQRDDVAILLDGRDARRQASQGEQRSLALALRLAGHELVRSRRGLDPLLLLDDVFSELDPLRSDRLLKLLPSGQTLVTTASPLPVGMHPASIIDLTEVST